ncbi:putative membrane protein, putative phage gene [Aliivibrio salmonicida LFI1238]|uniref:Membrane protein, putative phage protein n=1 Tax=Aliivibrio salmonicida (strain LFI1238) TaxID=316275 RepID=B6EMF1_ALISL|nr:putative membrane protein, putative phage gene [Aliivibrio salmonicida LFI1238]
MAVSLRSSIAKRRSHLNVELVYKSRKGVLFRELVWLLCFAPVGLLITGTFRWHYMGSVRGWVVTYWF